jgi:hypothetical protein
MGRERQFARGLEMPDYQQIMDRLGYYFLNDTRIVSTEDSIEAFESSLGAKLPSDYRRFQLEFAGSAFTGFVATPLTIPSLGEQISVEFFYGFFRTEGQYFSPLDLRYACRVFTDSLSSGLISIASAYYGNQFCLSLRSVDFGSIHFWDHESPLAQKYTFTSRG